MKQLDYFSIFLATIGVLVIGSVIVFFWLLAFQPVDKQCQPAIVIELESNLSANTFSDFMIAARTDEGLVVTDDANAEYFYTLQVGDEVQACEMAGKYIPTHDFILEEE